MTGGVDIADYKDRNQRYYIRIQVEPGQRTNVESLKQLFVRNKQGDLVRLDTLVRVEEGLGPSVITRRNRQYASFVYGNLEPTLPLGTATGEVEKDCRTNPAGRL